MAYRTEEPSPRVKDADAVALTQYQLMSVGFECRIGHLTEKLQAT
jgi:hypothetical protein